MGQAANSAAAEWSQKFFDGLPHPGRTKDPGGDASASKSARGRATDSPEQLNQFAEEPQLDQPWAGPGGGGPSTLNWGGGGLRPTGEGDAGGLSSPCAGAPQYGGHTSFSGWAPPVLQQPQLAPLKHPGEAEADLQRKTEQILVVAKQIQSIQAELQRLSLPPPPVQAPASMPASQADAIAQEAAKARVAEARELAANVSPQLASMKEKLATTTKVARKLNSWFVENAEKMNIQDPQLTPSAFLERLLESAGNRMEVLAAGVGQVTEGVQPAQAPAAEPPKQQEVVHQPATPAATIRPYAGSIAAQQAPVPPEASGAGLQEPSPHSSPTAVAQPVSRSHSSGAASLQESSPQSSPTPTAQPDAQTSLGSGDLRGAKPRAVPPPTTRPRLSAGQPSAEGAATAASWSGQQPSSSAAPGWQKPSPSVAMWVRDPDANQ